MELSSFIEAGILIALRENGNRPTSLALDSREVKKGSLFFAIPGLNQDGSAFVREALEKGATIIVAPQESAEKIVDTFKEAYPSVSFFGTADIRKTVSLLAHHFYPLQPETVVAVTGTNGKTSVVSFIRQIWHSLGIPAASLGTLGLIIEGKPLPDPTGTEGLNTPDPIKLHQILEDLKKQHIDHLAFEASSHGLYQHRLDGVRLKVGVFTNFSNDHLDYHQSLDKYFEAKARLFEELLDGKSYAILNADIKEYEPLLAICKQRHLPFLTFGKAGQMVKLVSLAPHPDCQEVSLSIDGVPYALTLPLVGEFQVYNVMAALTAVIACGGDVSQAVQACSRLKGVPGRLERAAPGIYVDYAHSPDGLSLALQTLRPHVRGNLWVVFGCGGNRDIVKRPMMGEIAAKLADKVIVTDDNPRYEDPAFIRKQVLAACSGAHEVSSRAQAIQEAVEGLKEGDILLIAGKGHERYQLVGNEVIPFNDVEEVKKWVKI